MKLKFLLLGLLFTSGALLLVITEANLHPAEQAYLELTNMDDKPILLSDFKLGFIDHDVVPWKVCSGRLMHLPEKILDLDKSFVLASATDFHAERYTEGEDGYAEKMSETDSVVFLMNPM